MGKLFHQLTILSYHIYKLLKKRKKLQQKEEQMIEAMDDLILSEEETMGELEDKLDMTHEAIEEIKTKLEMPEEIPKSKQKGKIAIEKTPSLEINKAKKKVQHQQQQKEVNNLFGKKLKKTDTVKSTWKAAEVERVHLKHHEFEPFPQDD